MSGRDMGENLCEFGLGKNCLDITSRARLIKEVDKFDCIKIKNFSCHY